MSPRERRCLQAAIGIASLVPILAGIAGILGGIRPFGSGLLDAAADSHVRYLSGLLLGAGLGFVSMIPRIETASRGFRLLTLIVVCGGLARLADAVLSETAPLPVLFALTMELGVTPMLWWWQSRTRIDIQ